MKEKLLSLKENKKAILILILLLMMICVGISYAYWQLTLQQEEANLVKTGCFNIVFTEQNDIQLEKAYPMKDTEASSLTPYTFTIENTCDSPASYQVNLETMSQDSGIKVLPDKYLKASLIEVDSTNTSTHNLTGEYEVEKTIENAVKAYKLDTGIIQGKEKKTFELRLWLDYDTPAIDEVMNATYNGKISITSSYLAIPNNMMMAKDFHIDMATGEGDIDKNTMQITSDSFWQYNQQIKTITFESTLNPKSNASYTYDISANQDGSVMVYLIENGTVEVRVPAVTRKTGVPVYTTEIKPAYDMYIQANGKIYANYDSSLWFSFLINLTEINNIENLDTSYVANMSYMFYYMNSLTTLAVSHFDTSNVTNMISMFNGMTSLTALDVSHFDTSNVTNMSYMFNSMTSLTTLDVSHFDTSNVTNMMGMFASNSLTTLDLSQFDTSNVTNMIAMFNSMELLTTLDVSNFDTSNVTDMSSMFRGMSSLTTLDVSHFDTSNVTNMSHMFAYMSSLTALNLSGFDTASVTDMSLMFANASTLSSIDYGSKFIYANDADVTNMFRYCPANRPTDPSWEGLDLD